MKAKFNLMEMTQSWTSGAARTATEKEFVVGDGEGFDAHPKTGQPLFILLKGMPDKALVKYHLEFTLKGYEHPGNKELWIEKGETKTFSHLWGNNGLTKKLTYSGTEA